MELFFHVHSEKALHALLRQERARADRSGNEFSFLLIDVSEIISSKKEIKEYFVLLNKKYQLRETDTVGWYNKTNICIILPFTNSEGASILAAKLEQIYLTHSLPFNYIIYSYPHGDKAARKGKVLPHASGSDLLPVALAVAIPIWKRTIDIIGACLGLILLFPVFFLLAVYIKLVSPGPVFFKQQRVGYRGKLFTMYKFRTMYNSGHEHFHQLHAVDFIKNDKQMVKLDCKNDTRIIPGGCLIRNACLDELAQLINVVRGEMSLVGPRPCIPYEEYAYSQWHRNRFNILPGLTGLWQVSGKNRLTFQQMVRLDITYYKNLSLWQDIRIMLLTVPTILSIMARFITVKLRINHMNNMNNEQAIS